MSSIPDFSSHGYQAIRELGRNRETGRITYLATSTLPKQEEDKKGVRVVIKEFRFAIAGADWSGFKAYQREIEVLQQLSHPRIPRYLDSFETPHGFCLVQEYKDAPSLAEKHSFTPEQIKLIALSVLEILAELQQRTPPVIHRDIKPENILVDEQLNAYLVDFGFARIRGGELALSSVAAGTPGFMPPEEQFGRTLTEASDLYSLGATLICLLTGTRSADVGKLIDDDYRFSFKHLVPQLNVAFAEWLEKMVASSVKERYANARVALAALKPVDVAGGVTLADSQVRAGKLRKRLLLFSVFYSAPATIFTIFVTLFILLPCMPVIRLQVIKECRGCWINNADLKGADLEHALLEIAHLEGAHLEGAQLLSAFLLGAYLEGAHLERANLVGAHLERANLGGADLQGANLHNTYLQGAYLERANLQRANLQLALLESTHLQDANLWGADLRGAHLVYAYLKGANLEGANLEGANLEGAFLLGANLKGAKLEGANFKGAKIDNDTKLEDKWHLVWRIVNEGAQGADLKGAYLKGAQLWGANLEDANLRGANLEGANLQGANLQGANLKGAHLESANLENAKLKGAIMPHGTKHE